DLPRALRRSRPVRWAALAAAVLISSGLPAAIGQTPSPPPAGQEVGGRSADLVVLGAKVLTVDRTLSVAEAVAVRDGVFTLVGTSAQARALVGPATRVIDAAGRTVIPGLIDS